MASTNKTENLKLNQWLGNDYLKREDLNSDNKKIDDKFKQIDTKLSKGFTWGNLKGV